jgi:hypothetical protein
MSDADTIDGADLQLLDERDHEHREGADSIFYHQTMGRFLPLH